MRGVNDCYTLVIPNNPHVVIDFPGAAVERERSVSNNPFNNFSHMRVPFPVLKLHHGTQHATGFHGFKGIIDVFQLNTLGDKAV